MDHKRTEWLQRAKAKQDKKTLFYESMLVLESRLDLVLRLFVLNYTYTHIHIHTFLTQGQEQKYNSEKKKKERL